MIILQEKSLARVDAFFTSLARLHGRFFSEVFWSKGGKTK